MRNSVLLTVFITILGPTSLIAVKAEDLVYVAVDPCRIVDTRNAGGAIVANTFRNFRVSGTLGELAIQGGKTDCLDPKEEVDPLAISAYVLAVPATGSTAGVLTAYPSDQPPPPVGAGSTVNFAAGQITGNTTNVTLCDPAGCPANGEFAILSRDTDEHVVIDVQGYFYPMTSSTEPATTPPRFVDNGDGTVSDNQTGLMWEKKLADDGSDGGNCDDSDQLNRDVHCVNNYYTWSDSTDGDETNPDGTAFMVFLATLNADVFHGFEATCFANYCDWRIPRLPELRSLTLSEEECLAETGSLAICFPAILFPDKGEYLSFTSSGSQVGAWGSYTHFIGPDGFFATTKSDGIFCCYFRAVRRFKNIGDN